MNSNIVYQQTELLKSKSPKFRNQLLKHWGEEIELRRQHLEWLSKINDIEQDLNSRLADSKNLPDHIEWLLNQPKYDIELRNNISSLRDFSNFSETLYSIANRYTRRDKIVILTLLCFANAITLTAFLFVIFGNTNLIFLFIGTLSAIFDITLSLVSLIFPRL